MITSLEIRKLEFNKKLGGYDPAEVRSALESIAKEMENMTRENTALNEQLKLTEERLNHFRLIEKTLQDSVLTMQTTLEEKRKSAEQEAELIIQESRQRASNDIQEYTERKSKLQEEISSLETQRQNYFIRFKNFCQSQLDWLDVMESQKESLKEPPLPISEFKTEAG